ncbi:MAG: efflux RND transporter periplasmic adaptor subunit [Candidatus Gastranaerophilales bacterium]|nr:efflux RND transporter periplasmic adaptor subunit [Candidatus Gastranaerophilales bacterium]
MNKKRFTTKAVIVFIVAILILSVVFRFLSVKYSEKETDKANRLASIPLVEVMKPFNVDTKGEITAPGRVAAVKSADVIARVQGMILKQHYKDGDYVKQGQLLYTIDPEEFQIAFDKAKANLQSARANQYQAQKDFERASELVKNDFVSKSSYDQALAAKDAANASVQANQAALNDARRLLSYTKVTAPITGKISLPVVTVGNYLSSPNTVLTKIVSVDPIYVKYSLDSGLFNQMKENEIIPNSKQNTPIKVEVTLPDGTVYDKTGVADFSDNTISETTGAITLRATFPNPDAVLIPGDFVNVRVYSNKVLTRIAVPQSAVLQDTSGRYLFVIDENNVAHKRVIVTDGQKDDNWIILSGINADEKFVSSGVMKVRDGITVKTEEKNLEKIPETEETKDTPNIEEDEAKLPKSDENSENEEKTE